MLPDRVSNPGPLALESDELQTVLHGLASGPVLIRLSISPTSLEETSKYD